MCTISGSLHSTAGRCQQQHLEHSEHHLIRQPSKPNLHLHQCHFVVLLHLTLFCVVALFSVSCCAFLLFFMSFSMYLASLVARTSLFPAILGLKTTLKINKTFFETPYNNSGHVFDIYVIIWLWLIAEEILGEVSQSQS